MLLIHFNTILFEMFKMFVLIVDYYVTMVIFSANGYKVLLLYVFFMLFDSMSPSERQYIFSLLIHTLTKPYSDRVVQKWFLIFTTNTLHEINYILNGHEQFRFPKAYYTSCSFETINDIPTLYGFLFLRMCYYLYTSKHLFILGPFLLTGLYFSSKTTQHNG